MSQLSQYRHAIDDKAWHYTPYLIFFILTALKVTLYLPLEHSKSTSCFLLRAFKHVACFSNGNSGSSKFVVLTLGIYWWLIDNWPLLELCPKEQGMTPGDNKLKKLRSKWENVVLCSYISILKTDYFEWKQSLYFGYREIKVLIDSDM